MSDHDPINELTDVVDLFGAGAGRAGSAPVVDDGLPKWIDNEKGKDPLMDDIIAHLINLNAKHAGQMRQAMREAYEAGRAAGVPDGWKLMPAEPTPAMKQAGGHANSEWLNDNAPIGEARYAIPMESVYAAMLAAAPQPPKDAP